MNLTLSHIGLTADRVRQLCPAPLARQRRPGHPYGTKHYTHINAVDAWLEKSQPGDRCDRNTFGIPHVSAFSVFKGMVRAGKLRLVKAGKRGPHGTPAIYEKV
jgi:hypothetical protein